MPKKKKKKAGRPTYKFLQRRVRNLARKLEIAQRVDRQLRGENTALMSELDVLRTRSMRAKAYIRRITTAVSETVSRIAYEAAGDDL
jgi:hypothetical protein